MNLFDSSFLCLDIGTQCVRGIAHRVRSARIANSAMYSAANSDTVFAIKSVIDELERQIGTHFDTAYITGNLGHPEFSIIAKSTVWRGEHKINLSDIKNQISQISAPDGYYPMHILPMRYETPTAHDMFLPAGHTDKQLISVFGAIFYPHAAMDTMMADLRHAHIQPAAFYDSMFLQNIVFRPNGETTMFIDFGAEQTRASVWIDRGPIWYQCFNMGGTDITQDISDKLKISFDDADRIKRNVASLIPKEMDRFTPADTEYEFSRADINDLILPYIVDICARIKDECATVFQKHPPKQILISGGGAEIGNITEFVENVFGIPVKNIGSDANVRALSEYIWNADAPHRAAYTARHARMQRVLARTAAIFKPRRRKKNRVIPIMPSTLCFDMKNPATYSMFSAGGISIIHVDIMDGLYVDRIAGSIAELKQIRARTNAHLHVHLMTESPDVWATDAIAAGADTIIVSTNTSGLRSAIRAVKSSGRRIGIALNPDSSVSILKPVLRDIDEIMIMAVMPGAAGQEFDPSCLHKISVLRATRKKYDLKFLISVDGGINPDTAQQCWDAGADMLVSGSYLARNSDFPLAVQSLLKKQSE